LLLPNPVEQQRQANEKKPTHEDYEAGRRIAPAHRTGQSLWVIICAENRLSPGPGNPHLGKPDQNQRNEQNDNKQCDSAGAGMLKEDGGNQVAGGDQQGEDFRNGDGHMETGSCTCAGYGVRETDALTPSSGDGGGSSRGNRPTRAAGAIRRRQGSSPV